MKNKTRKPCRLMLDFLSEEDLSEFLQKLRYSGEIQTGHGAYRCDALDFSRQAGGIGRKDTYVLRDADHANGRQRLTITREVPV